MIIGCGGLGCPSALYLSTSGVGCIGLVDNDSVEISNIHRQIAHEISHVGINKAKNLADKCRSYYLFIFKFKKKSLYSFIRLNDKIKYQVHEVLFDKSSAVGLIEQYPFEKNFFKYFFNSIYNLNLF